MEALVGRKANLNAGVKMDCCCSHTTNHTVSAPNTSLNVSDSLAKTLPL